MKKSFLRVQDWAPEINILDNPFWNNFLRSIDEFQHLIDTEKKELNQCLRQQYQKRQNLIKKYCDYKRSLKYQGDLMKVNVSFLDSEKTRYFFSGYHETIEEIIIKLISKPSILANILSTYKQYKKYNSFDFSQNLILTIYPSYLPTLQSLSMNKCLEFVRQIIQKWDYSIEQGRPLTYTIIDQIITGFMKSPQIICYVQKISMTFMKEINKCKMDFFAFDEEAVKNQIQVKKSMALSMKANTQPKSRWQKFTSYFKKKEDIQISDYHSQISQVNDHTEFEINAADIMRRRQKDFISVVKKTIDVILDEQPPFFLKKMLHFFHEKIHKANSLNEEDIRNLKKAKVGIFKNHYRHYCYFLMTNLIFEQLHNKFTIAHEDTGMTPADLQNITQIIRIMSNIFQGCLPEGQKYKNESIALDLKHFLPKIPLFYEKTFQINIQVISKEFTIEEMKVSEQSKLREQLLLQHENTIILSFNDVKILIDSLNQALVSNKKYAQMLNLSEDAKKMRFLSDHQTKGLFDPNTKRIDFSNNKYQPENILFVFNQTKIIQEIYESYLGNDSPLKNLPAFTNALLYESSLTVSQALQLTKSINTIRFLPLKEMKYFLAKLAHRYQNLYLKNNETILNKFLQEIEISLQRYLKQKSNMLIWRQELLNKMGSLEKVINFYCDQLQSSQFYDRISEAFIHNIKIKLFVNIQNDQFRVNSNINNLKGMQLQGILISDKNKIQENENYLLRHSFKSFTNIRDLLRTITSNTITKAALVKGRRVDEFNDAFIKICEIIVSYIQDFINKRQILQNLSKEKLGKVIISKIQDHIFDKCRSDGTLEQDHQLKEAKTMINIEGFFKKDLEQFSIDWQFLVDESIKKFKIIMGQISISDKLKHFEELFRMIFTIIGFTMPKNKISAQIITPIIQYLILCCPNIKHYECLYCLQCLKWNSSPQTSYNITLYHSSLHYISKIMKEDYPI